MPNARLSERAPFFAEVDVVAAGLPAPRRVWGTDVSETGIFLQTTQPFRVGDRVSLRFDVEDREVHIRAAEVMWVRTFEPVSVDGHLPGVGVKFVAVDPPARAALRKFVQPSLADTLPEHDAAVLASLPPPAASLPPITQSILAKTGRVEVTDEMLAVSLPPFSQTPSLVAPMPDLSLPPDEPSGVPGDVRVFRQTRPSPVTIAPKPSSSPPTFLVGWTFRRDEPPPPPPEPKLDLRFDDEGPAPGHHTLADDAALDATSTPPEGVLRDDALGDSALGDGPRFEATLDRDLEEGRIAVRHLPIAEERRATPKAKKKSRSLEAAVALLVAGTVVGSGIGFATKRWERHRQRLAEAHAVHPAQPAHAPAVAAAATPAPQTTMTPTTTTTTQKTATTVATAAHTVKPVGEAERGLPRDTLETLTDAAPTPAVEKHAAAEEREDPRGKATVKVGDAEIARVFTLDRPTRVVVDMRGAKLPKDALTPGDGITRIRFGHPAKGIGRVVLELARKRRPTDVQAEVRGGVLDVKYR